MTEQTWKLWGMLAGLSILVISSPASALSPESQRYPTEAEIQNLTNEFDSLVRQTEQNKVGSNYIRDRRSTKELNGIKSFNAIWSQADPEVVPFLGAWSGYEYRANILPSKNKGRVCLIYTGEGMGSFGLATVRNGKLYANGNKVYFRRGKYLVEAGVYKGKAEILGNIPLNNPGLITEYILGEIAKYIIELNQRESISENFRNSGCTGFLPEQEQIDQLQRDSSKSTCLAFAGNGWAEIYKEPNQNKVAFSTVFKEIVSIIEPRQSNNYIHVKALKGYYWGGRSSLYKPVRNEVSGWLPIRSSKSFLRMPCPGNTNPSETKGKAQFLKEKGNRHYENNEWQEAIAVYTQAIGLSPRYAALYYTAVFSLIRDSSSSVQTSYADGWDSLNSLLS
jgi:tetratricopeptide (TPR) repeat protein